MKKRNQSTVIALAFAIALFAVLLVDIWQVFRLTSSLTLSSGQYHLESISGELENTISDAERLAMKLAISAAPLLEDKDKLREYIYAKKAEVLAEESGCFNVYIAGTDWAMIPDFDMPDDYVATERDWYKGAKLAQGDTYVTAPYVDAMTGDICYSVSVMLGDTDSVLALDYTMDNIQSHIVQMYENGSQLALIVTGDGVIAGCSDQKLIGRHLPDVLPEYASLFALVKSRQSFVTTRIKADILYENLFAAASGFGWYLIVGENDWYLYRDSYLLLFGSALVAILLLGIIITVYLISDRRQRAALAQVESRDQLLRRITGELEEPLREFLDSDESEDNSVHHMERMIRLRTAARQTRETLLDAERAAEQTRSLRKQKKRKQSSGEAPKMNARFRTRILLLMVVVVVISFTSHLMISLRWGNEKLHNEINSYDYTLSEWVGQQKSILDMFCSVISTNPEMLKDYDQTIAYLDRITQQYPEISATYMANPKLKPTVYMNNGYVPPDGWRVEERQWWIDTMASESGWTISAPYYDVRTGLYCVTFAERVYDSRTGEFLGNFGIDFIMDKLIGILSGSYSDTGYAFLADTDGVIVNHPNVSYQMTESNATNVSEVLYGQVKADGKSSLTIRDYDGTLRMITAKRNAQSHFTVYEAVDFYSIYSTTLLSELLVLLVLLLCAAMVYRLLTGLMLWQEQMNERMKEAADTAIAAGKAKSRFLAQMSHEIRTPINAVLGMNEMILRESGDETVLDYASNIQTAGKTLLSLINSILDFSKIEEGKMEVIPVVYETTSFINNLVASISERARSKGLELVVDVDPELPTKLYGDDVRLSQVIMNLLTNAVKYTPQGEVRFSVQGGERKDGFLELQVSVEDTGIGIRSEDLPKLFDSFERLDEVRNHNIEGTGLGMSIVTRLLKMMDSRLKVESVYGKGSSFSFTVRQKITDEAPIGDYSQRLAVSRRTIGSQTLQASNARVLVVDDNEMNLKVAKNLLKLFGIEPDLAFSGYEAIEAMGSRHYHLVFLDHMMPKMDGVETLNTLKQDGMLPEDTVVIVLTANAVNGAKEQYLTAGFDDYLSKPIDVEKLEAQLRRYLPKELCTTKDTHAKEAPKEAAEKELEAQQEGNDSIAALKTAGFDTEAGLRYAAGDEAFYLELADSFAQSAAQTAASIRQDWERHDVENYQIRVHALKSTARQIGASDLSELALNQEMAAKARDIAAIDAGAKTLLSRYEETADALRTALGIIEDASASSDEAAGELVPITPEELQSLLTEAGESIENFEAENAAETLRSLTGRSCEGMDLGIPVGEIIQALEEFDTFTAAERLEALLQQFQS